MVVQTLNGALHQVNDYPVDKYNEEQLCYPLDRDLSGGWRCPRVEPLGPGHNGPWEFICLCCYLLLHVLPNGCMTA